MAPLTGLARGAAAFSWPFAHIALATQISEEAVKESKAGKLPPADGRPEYRGKGAATSVMEHVLVQMATFPKLVVALIVYSYFFPDVSAFATLDFKSAAFLAGVKSIVLRDLVVTWIAAGACVSGARRATAGHEARATGGKHSL